MQACLDGARDKANDPARIKEFLTIAREEQARLILNPLIIAASEKLPPIVADAKNTHTNSKYAKLEKIERALDPVMRELGLGLTWGMGDSPMPDHYRLYGTLIHKQSGAQRDYFMDAPSDAAGPKGGGTKSLVQGVKSSISYMKRILECLIFNIRIIGEDFDGNAMSQVPTTISEAQLKQLNAAIDVKNVNVTDFCQHYGIESVADLPVARFDHAMKLIEKKK